MKDILDISHLETFLVDNVAQVVGVLLLLYAEERTCVAESRTH